MTKSYRDSFATITQGEVVANIEMRQRKLALARRAIIPPELELRGATTLRAGYRILKSRDQILLRHRRIDCQEQLANREAQREGALG